MTRTSWLVGIRVRSRAMCGLDPMKGSAGLQPMEEYTMITHRDVMKQASDEALSGH
ncbi:MAG: hypothetical protein JSR31_09005 [Nitrospira sp.]|nr:hypothetical protein [Nitrospira sp.]